MNGVYKVLQFYKTFIIITTIWLMKCNCKCVCLAYLYSILVVCGLTRKIWLVFIIVKKNTSGFNDWQICILQTLFGGWPWRASGPDFCFAASPSFYHISEIKNQSNFGITPLPLDPVLWKNPFKFAASFCLWQSA